MACEYNHGLVNQPTSYLVAWERKMGQQFRCRQGFVTSPLNFSMAGIELGRIPDMCHIPSPPIVIMNDNLFITFSYLYRVTLFQ